MSAIAGGDIKQAIGPEVKLAAIMIGCLTVWDHQQDAARLRVRAIWIIRVPAEFVDFYIAFVVGKRDIEAAALCIVWRESHRQQASLIAGVGIRFAENQVTDIEERPHDALLVA